MLYQIYETQRSLLAPFSELANTAAKAFSNAANPMSKLPLMQRTSAAYALTHRLLKDYEKPEFGIRSIQVAGHEIAIHERVITDKPFCELRRFKRFSDDPKALAKIKSQPAMLIVAPLSGHYATLLRETVRTMLEGHKVYITDWKNACMVPTTEGSFHLDDYVNYVQEFIRTVQGLHGRCHVMSVCQPTVPTLAAVSLMASRGEQYPISMTMMGGPIDARRSPTSVNDLATTKSHNWFKNNVIYRVPSNYPGAGRKVYPGFLQHAGFVAMNPDRHASSHYDYFQNLIKGDLSSAETHQNFYDEYNAVLDMDADYYLETIKTVFQDFSLVKGTWRVRNEAGKEELVRPQSICDAALLTVEGELDDISGSGQTRAAHDLCVGITESKRQHLEVQGAGHYGIFSGRRWREVVYPQVKAFVLAQEAAARKAETKVSAHDLANTDKTATANTGSQVKTAANKQVPRRKPKSASELHSVAQTKPARKRAVTPRKAETVEQEPDQALLQAHEFDKVAVAIPEQTSPQSVQADLASDATPEGMSSQQPGKNALKSASEPSGK